MEFTFNSVTLLRTFVINTVPIFFKLYMKYHLRIKNGKYGDAANFYVMSDSFNGGRVCA